MNRILGKKKNCSKAGPPVTSTSPIRGQFPGLSFPDLPANFDKVTLRLLGPRCVLVSPLPLWELRSQCQLIITSKDPVLSPWPSLLSPVSVILSRPPASDAPSGLISSLDSISEARLTYPTTSWTSSSCFPLPATYPLHPAARAPSKN